MVYALCCVISVLVLWHNGVVYFIPHEELSFYLAHLSVFQSLPRFFSILHPTAPVHDAKPLKHMPSWVQRTHSCTYSSLHLISDFSPLFWDFWGLFMRSYSFSYFPFIFYLLPPGFLLFPFLYLDASSHLYGRVCPSILRSVRCKKKTLKTAIWHLINNVANYWSICPPWLFISSVESLGRRTVRSSVLPTVYHCLSKAIFEQQFGTTETQADAFWCRNSPGLVSSFVFFFHPFFSISISFFSCFLSRLFCT